MSWVTCGRCQHPFDLFFVLGSSSLGPAVVVCRLCRTPFESGRTEWADFNRRQRARYAIRSLFYAVLVAYCFGHVSFTSYYFLWDFRQHSALAFLHNPAFGALTVAVAALVLALQFWRVVRSRRRTRSQEPYIMPPWLLDLDFALQFKVILLLGAASLLATGTGRWLRSDPTRGRRMRQKVATHYVAPGYCRSSESSEKFS